MWAIALKCIKMGILAFFLAAVGVNMMTDEPSSASHELYPQIQVEPATNTFGKSYPVPGATLHEAYVQSAPAPQKVDPYAGQPEEDEAGFDCRTMRNKQCGPTKTLEPAPKKKVEPTRKSAPKQAEDGSTVRPGFYDEPLKACRGKRGTDEGDLNRNGWIDPNEPAWREVCYRK